MSGVSIDRWLELWPAVHSGAFGLLYDHSSHNVLVDTSHGSISARHEWVASLMSESTGFTRDGAVDRVGCGADMGSLGTAVFVATGIDARNLGESAFGPATGRSVSISTATLALVNDDRIYRAWRFVDRAALVEALGLHPADVAASLAAGAPSRGGVPWEYGEVRAGLGQSAPAESGEPTIGLPFGLQAWSDGVRTQWNARRLSRVNPLYMEDAKVAAGFQPLRPLEQFTDHPWWSLLTAMPDAVLFFERGCASDEPGGNQRVAVLWRWVGRHTGPGLGVPPSGHRLHLRGVTYLELRQGGIVLERVFTDRIGTLADIYRRSKA
ncbi:MAG: ester cyclase [Vicinamibacterales bacterium]